MISIAQHIFGNIFSERRISSIKIIEFTEDALEKLIKRNTNHQFDDLIDCLKIPLAHLKTRLNNYNYISNQNGSNTISKNQFILLFKKSMMDHEPLIAKVSGGTTSPLYLEFYPHGISEYQKSVKERIPFLINRVYKVATANSLFLKPDLQMSLQSFKFFLENYKIESTNEKLVLTRKNARNDLENALLKVIHSIAISYPGDANYCCSFFDFNILFRMSNKKKNKENVSKKANHMMAISKVKEF